MILKYPPVYWWDAFTRIWDADQLIVRHWLPIPQIPVILIEDLPTLRAVYALVAAAGTVALGLGVARVWSRREGLLFGFLIALQPLILKWTIVPYQEAFLLLLLGLTVIALPRGLRHEDDPRLVWMGVAALTAACLCRYEAWVFAMLLGAGAVFRKGWRAVRYLTPILVVMVVWLAVRPGFESLPGGPEASQPSGLVVPLDQLVAVAWKYARHITVRLEQQVTWVGIALALWGFAVAAWRGGASRRELALLGLAFIGLALLRSINAERTTTRMLLFPLMSIGLFAAVAWFDLLDRLPKRVPRWVLYGVTALIAAWLIWAHHARVDNGQRRTARSLRAEAELATKLRAMPADAKVAIFPRRKRNIRKESTVRAIFANQPSLDPHAPRWYYRAKDPRDDISVPDFVARYEKKRKAYIITKAPPQLREKIRQKLESREL
jgi:hypothetical protein